MIDALLLTVAIIGTRVSFRLMNLVAATRNKRSRRVLVYGAGSFGQLLVREMRANVDWSMNPVAFIDDDPMKAHRWIVGVPVRGTLDDLAAGDATPFRRRGRAEQPVDQRQRRAPHSRSLRHAGAAGAAAAHGDSMTADAILTSELPVQCAG